MVRMIIICIGVILLTYSLFDLSIIGRDVYDAVDSFLGGFVKQDYVSYTIKAHILGFFIAIFSVFAVWIASRGRWISSNDYLVYALLANFLFEAYSSLSVGLGPFLIGNLFFNVSAIAVILFHRYKTLNSS